MAAKIKMNKYLIIITLILIGCKSETDQSLSKIVYPNFIGDIEFDQSIDGDFERCDPYSNQYYGINGGVGYHGEMSEIKQKFFNNYKTINLNGQTGILTIRFVVNCKGQTGMFRIFSTDLLLNEFSFNNKIVTQFLNISKKLDGWEVAEYDGNTYDYYQHLNFKLIDGELIEITP